MKIQFDTAAFAGNPIDLGTILYILLRPHGDLSAGFDPKGDDWVRSAEAPEDIVLHMTDPEDDDAGTVRHWTQKGTGLEVAVLCDGTMRCVVRMKGEFALYNHENANETEWEEVPQLVGAKD